MKRHSGECPIKKEMLCGVKITNKAYHRKEKM